MAMKSVPVDSKAKVEVFCKHKSKFIDTDTFPTLFFSLHGILNDSSDLVRWTKANSTDNDSIIVNEITSIFFYNYGLSPITIQYDDEIIDEVSLDSSTGCN